MLPYLHIQSLITVETDNKPLEVTAFKNLTATPSYHNRLLLYLQQYDATIKYKPGSDMQLPDTLFRLSSIRQRDEIPLNLHVDHITFSDGRLALVCKETENCLVLHIVYRLTQNRWPATHRQVPRVSHKY